MTDNYEMFRGMDVDMIETQNIRRKHIVFRNNEGDVKLVEIQEISKSKPGKHGAAKYTFVGHNLITGKFVEFTEATKVPLTTCTLKKSPCFLISIDERKDEFTGYNEEKGTNFSIPLSKVPKKTLEELQNIQEASPDAQIRFVFVETNYMVNIIDIVVDTS